MGEREERIGQNESYWREINELAAPEPGVLNRVFCECGRIGCGETVLMTAGEYESVRAHPTRFVVIPGHELVGAEVTLETTERYRVIEKIGDAAAVAVENDTR